MVYWVRQGFECKAQDSELEGFKGIKVYDGMGALVEGLPQKPENFVMLASYCRIICISLWYTILSKSYSE